MCRRTFVAAALALAAMTPRALVADTDRADLRAVTERGRTLYAYDQNAAFATDAVMTAHAVLPARNRYIGHREKDGSWIFDFGTLGPDHDFLVHYETTRRADAATADVKSFDPPQSMTGFLPNAARAVGTAVGALVPSDDGKYRYNYAVLPGPEGQLYVYCYPGQKTKDVYAFGGDERFLIAADGSAIIETHRMHMKIMEFPNGKIGGDYQAVAGVNSDVYGDIPEDSDVLLVLTRRPSAPQYVAAGGRLFKIAVDGTIEDTGPLK